MLELNNNNFRFYCLSIYNNVQCVSIDEFNYDVNRFTMLKKLLFRFVYKNESCELLIINHLKILFNSFGDNTYKLLEFKMQEKYHEVISAFLHFMKLEPLTASIDTITLDRLMK